MVVDVSAIAKPGIASVVALIVLGLLATGFATLLYFRLIQGPGPTFLSFVNYLVPAWALIAGAVFLDEPLTPAVFLGLSLILAGIAFSEFGARLMQTLRAIRLRRQHVMQSSIARNPIPATKNR